MFETVSVDDALKRGKRIINLPVIFIIALGFIIPIGIVAEFYLSGWVIAAGVIAGFLLAWLYWSMTIVNWRLWAFDNVRNVHELKKRAIKDKLIWKDGSFFVKTEIWSAEQRAKWASLQYKFEQEDIFNDDLTVPAEIQIAYSRPTAIFLVLLGLVLISAAYFYMINEAKSAVMGYLFMLGGFILIIIGCRNYFDRRPRIILSNEGVESKKTQFYSWAEIRGEDTKVEQHGKSSTTYFIYYCPEGQKKISIGDLSISKSRLELLLRVYRGRYEQGLGKRIHRGSTVI